MDNENQNDNEEVQILPTIPLAPQTIEDWKQYMTEEIREYVERTQLSLGDWMEWRELAWESVYLSFDGMHLSELQKYVEDIENFQTLVDSEPINGCILAQEAQQWVKIQIDLIQSTTEDADPAWFYEQRQQKVKEVYLTEPEYTFLTMWHTHYKDENNIGDVVTAKVLANQMGLSVEGLAARKLMTYTEQGIGITETGIQSLIKTRDKETRK